MRIGWVGGLTRNDAIYERMAEAAGHSIEFHCGRVGGRGADDLRKLIERVDFVVILTEINSHGGVIQAKKLAQKAGRGTMVIRSCGVSRFASFLEALASRDARALLATG